MPTFLDEVFPEKISSLVFIPKSLQALCNSKKAFFLKNENGMKKVENTSLIKIRSQHNKGDWKTDCNPFQG